MQHNFAFYHISFSCCCGWQCFKFCIYSFWSLSAFIV